MLKIGAGVVVGLALAAAAAAQGLKVITPNAGETWRLGEYRTIWWGVNDPEATGTVDVFLVQGNTILGSITRGWPLNRNTASGSYVSPEFSPSPGMALSVAVGEYHDGHAYHFAQPGNNYKILIRKCGSTEEDSSDTYFTIAAATSQPGSITLTLKSPNGGEKWKAGSPQTLSWSSANLKGTVKLELVREPNTVVGVIATGLRTKGSHPWNAGQFQGGVARPGSYRVRVSSQAVPGLHDDSNLPFTLLKPPPSLP